jgi:hypothetical protein
MYAPLAVPFELTEMASEPANTAEFESSGTVEPDQPFSPERCPAEYPSDVSKPVT